jgi:chaperonin cofactor prefoldin
MNWIPERKKILQERIETLQNEVNEEFLDYIIFLQERIYGQVSAVFHHIELEKKTEILKLQVLRLQRTEEQLKNLQDLETCPE